MRRGVACCGLRVCASRARAPRSRRPAVRCFDAVLCGCATARSTSSSGSRRRSRRRRRRLDEDLALGAHAALMRPDERRARHGGTAGGERLAAAECFWPREGAVSHASQLPPEQTVQRRAGRPAGGRSRSSSRRSPPVLGARQLQAMKVAWIEDLAVVAPPIAFLVAVCVPRRQPASRRHPYSFHRAVWHRRSGRRRGAVHDGPCLFYDSGHGAGGGGAPADRRGAVFGQTLWRLAPAAGAARTGSRRTRSAGEAGLGSSSTRRRSTPTRR